MQYDVVGERAAPFEIEIYRSGDEAAAQTLLASQKVSHGADLAVGAGHRVFVDATFADLEADYELIAKVAGRSQANEAAAGQAGRADDAHPFQGGVFLATEGTLYVFGTDGPDRIGVTMEGANAVSVRFNDQEEFSYEPQQVSAVHIRTGQGDDMVTATAAVTVPLWVFVGEGHDYVRSGKGNDVLVGGPGDDYLYGESGDDVLVGGLGNDYLHGGPGDDIINGGQGQNTLIAGEGQNVVWTGSGQNQLDGRGATSIAAATDASTDDDGLTETLQVAAGWGLPSPTQPERNHVGESLRDSQASLGAETGPRGGIGIAADHVGGGSPVKRDSPISGLDFGVAGARVSSGSGLAADHTAGGPVLKRDAPAEEGSVLLPQPNGRTGAGIRHSDIGQPATVPLDVLTPLEHAHLPRGSADRAGDENQAARPGQAAQDRPGVQHSQGQGRALPSHAADTPDRQFGPSAGQPAWVAAPGKRTGEGASEPVFTATAGSGSGSGAASGSGSGQGVSFQPGQGALDGGYVVDPTVPFIPSPIGNYSSTTPQTTTTTETWVEGGVTYTATTVDNSTLTIVATLGLGDAWTYDESLVSTYTVTTTGDDGSTANESGSNNYTFTAFGTTDGAGAVVTTSYTFTAGGSSSASGSVTQTSSSGGWTDTTTYSWTWLSSFSHSVSNTTDLAADTGSGASAGNGSTVFSYTGTGSYSYDFEDGSLSGSLTTSGNDNSSYSYSTTAACSSGTWTETGTATVLESGGSTYSQTGSGTYSASGSGSSSGGGSDYDWSYCGTMTDSASGGSSYSGTTQFALNPQGSWQGSNGALSGSGSADWSYAAGGSYSYDFDGGSVTGSFSDSGNGGFSYGYSVTGTSAGGQWTESGTGTFTETGGGSSTYSGTGTVSASGTTAGSGGGSSYPWTTSGSMTESGNDSFSYTGTTQFALNASASWEPTTSNGSGNGASARSYSASGSYGYSFDGGSANGSFSDSGGDTFSYNYTVSGTYAAGAWTDTGTATATVGGNNSVSYSDTGTLATAGDGWTATATLSSHGSQSATWSYTTNLALGSEGQWEATGGSGGSSGLGSSTWSSTASGMYSYSVPGGTVSGTFGLSDNDTASYGFSTTATLAGGTWSETGSASLVDGGGGNSNYSATSTVYPSGEGWSATVTISESGLDSYLYLYTLGYVLNSEGGWDLDTASGGSGGNGMAQWSYTANGSYSYPVAASTISGTFSESANDSTNYSYSTSNTAATGVWVYSGFGTWSNNGGGNASFSANGPYTTADGISGTVTESGSESYTYHYTGAPALDSEGNWYWSTGSGTAGGNGSWTWSRVGSGPYSRSDGSTYSVSGTRSENMTESASYSYSVTASAGAGGTWQATGSGTTGGNGSSSSAYSGSGTFSSSTSGSGFNSTATESGASGYGYHYAVTFALADGQWTGGAGTAGTTSTEQEHYSYTGTTTSSQSWTWGDASAGGSDSQGSTLVETQTRDRNAQRNESYQWSPGAGSGSGSGSGSGAGAVWQLTSASESGQGTDQWGLNYTYDGNGTTWGHGEDSVGGWDSSSQWQSTQSVSQSRTTTENLSRHTLPGAGGALVTTGSHTRSVMDTGNANSTHDSQWHDESWSFRYTSDGGGTYQNTTHDDYDCQSSWTETLNADGTSTTSETASNDVSGTQNGTSTGWWSWSYTSLGSGGRISSSSSWSSSWSDSYSETVDYPGFYSGAYNAGGHYGYYGGWGAYPGYGGGGLLFAAASSGADADQVNLDSEHSGKDRGRLPKDRFHPGGGRSAFHNASPVWRNWLPADDIGTTGQLPASILIDVDAAGNLLSITDALGNRASYAYDAAGNAISVTDPNGDTTTFAYDAAGDLVELVDPLGNETTFAYDGYGQLISEEVTVDGTVLSRTYDYDASGNVVRKLDRNGRVRAFVYDDADRLQEEIWYDSVADAEADENRQNTITWTYDGAGNVLSAVDNFSSYVYVYDTSGRVTTETVASAGGPVTVLTADYGTPTDNLPVSISATVGGTPDFVTLYGYDAQGRLIDLKQTGQGGNAVADKHVTFAYKDSGKLVTVTRYASLDTTDLVAVSEYGYDDIGRLVILVHYQDAAQPLAEYSWTYEGGGNEVVLASDGSQSTWPFGFGTSFALGGLLAPSASAQVEVNPLPDYVWAFDTAFTGRLVQATSSDGTAHYSYDARGQLTGAAYDYQADESYAYDGNGNRTNPGYVTGDQNRLLSDGTYNYEYDAEGNRTKRTNIRTGAVTEYVWDHRNRLVEVIDRRRDGGRIVQTVQYVYDSQNRWIAKSLDPDGDGPKQATDTQFVYQANQIILQVNESAEVTNRYLWGPAVDQILADEQLQTDGTSEILWPLTDHLNTVHDLARYNADTAATTIVNHLVYDAFGNITSQSDATVTMLFAFTARPFDSDTGLQNNLNRWYDASVGRWLSEDPSALTAGDANNRRYCNNNPVTLVDPTGLVEVQPPLKDGVPVEYSAREWLKFQELLARLHQLTRYTKDATVATDGVHNTHSGWTQRQGYAQRTNEVAERLRKWTAEDAAAGVTGQRPWLTPDGYDRRNLPGYFAGRYYASHAEKQLSIVLEGDTIAVSKDICGDCMRYFDRLATEMGTPVNVVCPDWIYKFWGGGTVSRQLPSTW